ncbi:fused CCA tRNA nucleotidyltransferase/phosphohydrolase [Candidatus Nitrotoga sp. HW29]|nr:fused CCA tRNA nucleotidyltransferase/phosphohydrolase [Candidatus Nitrotoga sp. HW29]
MKDSGLKIYSVGGAVRDELLGLPVNDHDWVVVGSTPEDMVARGYTPVGKDFPVFLHPQQHEEYALARTERKTAPGYRGFAIHAAPDVTLEQDLQRRDFTINAIARDPDGNLIDPYNGIADLRAGILRHVSSAFSEDPVRILRAARFVARFGFNIAPETLSLMRAMVENGEVDALVPERVWQELARGLMEKVPSRFFFTLRDCGALVKILPEVDALFGVPQPPKYHPEIDCGIHTMLVLDDAAQHDYPLEVRFSALTHDLGKGNTPADILPRHIGHEVRSVDLLRDLCVRLRVPNECRDLGLLVARYHGNVHRAPELRPDTIVAILQSCDAWRRPERFAQLLQSCASDARGRTGHEQDAYPQAEYLLRMLRVTQTVDAGEIAQQCEDKSVIAEKVREARIMAVERAMER